MQSHSICADSPGPLLTEFCRRTGRDPVAFMREIRERERNDELRWRARAMARDADPVADIRRELTDVRRAMGPALDARIADIALVVVQEARHAK